MKRQPDGEFLTPSETLQLKEMPDLLLSEILTALRLKICTIGCNKFSLLSV